MRSHGLVAGAATANRLAIPIRGTAGQIERAFAISFRRVLTRDGTRAAIANAAPAFDRGIAGDVQAVIGLTSVSAPRPLLVRRGLASRRLNGSATRSHVLRTAGDAPAACSAASTAASSGGAYTADQIASIYGFSGLYSSRTEGQGQTVAIYELESYDPNDIAAYQACYGTHVSVANVAVDGGPPSGGGSGEAALDIEQVIGLAPKANVLVYEGPNSSNDAPGAGPYDTLSRIIADDRARVVSISWGQCEQAHGLGSTSVLDSEDTLLQEAATQGQSIVSATGDQGSEDCPSDPNLAVDDPGSQPFVTGVGGTTIESAGPPPTEAVWNRPGPGSPGQGGAGGGGLSDAWRMPGYQLDAPGALRVIGPYSSGSGCSNPGGYCREVPDVAADADPNTGYLFYFSGSWQGVGGTSAAAPLWAALLADANSSTACHGTAIGFANPVLYQVAAADYGKYFNDVATGTNDFLNAHGGLYPAGPRYDMASGLGSPNAATLAPALCHAALHVNNPGSQISTMGHAVSLRVTTSALPGVHLHFYATDLPPGLSISAKTGRITGRPKRIGTWRSGVAALGPDLSLRGAFFNWHVGGAPTISAARLSGVAAHGVRLNLTLTAGRKSGWLKVISIHLSRGYSIAHIRGRVSVAAKGAYTVVLVDGRLQIALRKPVWRIRVTIRPGAVKVSASVASAVRRHHSSLATIAVMTTDSTGHRVAVHARIAPQT
jgi:subtilase family serine protease